MLSYASDVGCTPSDRVESLPARTCADAVCSNRTAGVRCCSLAGASCHSYCDWSRNCRRFSCLLTLQGAIEHCAAQGQRLCERDEMCVADSRPLRNFRTLSLLLFLAASTIYRIARSSAGGVLSAEDRKACFRNVAKMLDCVSNVWCPSHGGSSLD